jgi:hypothetical protein
MIWAINDRALLGNVFSMPDVTPAAPVAVLDFIFIMALVTYSSEGGMGERILGFVIDI